MKVKSWFHDEVVQTTVREWIAGHPADQITACGLSGTARRWLNPLGLVHGRYTKDVYVGEHEREDAVFIARGGFLPRWNSLKRRMVKMVEYMVTYT